MGDILFNVAPYAFEPIDLECIGRLDEVQILSRGTLDMVTPGGIEILVTDEVPKDLRLWTDLRWVQLMSAGTNQLDDHPIWQTSIIVTTASGVTHVPAAQYMVGVILMMAHRLEAAMALRSSRRWPDCKTLVSVTLRDRTIGILGYGMIGRECARLAQALGMRVIAIDRSGIRTRDDRFNAWPGTGDPDGSIPLHWFSYDQSDRALACCDVLVVCAPRTPATTDLIKRKQLELLPHGAWVIVLSRGGIVREADLCDALHRGRVGAAAVDVFLREPVEQSHCLFAAPNVIMTPHVAGYSDQFWPKFCELCRANFSRWRQELPLLNVARVQGH